MRNRALVLLLVASALSISQPTSAQALPTYDELLKQVTPKLEGLQSWTSDIEMSMTMMGQDISATGTTATRGKLTTSDMTMTMMGQPMQVKTVLGADGVQWTDTNMYGQRQVTKMDLAQMQELAGAEALEGVPTDGDFMEDPSEMLQQYGEAFDMQVLSKEEIDGIPVYIVEGKLKSVGSTETLELGGMLAGMSEEMSAMGISMDPLKLAVGAEDGFVRSMAIGEISGKPWMTMSFKNVKTNIELADSLFTFTPPEGVPVTDLAEIVGEEMSAPQGPQFEIGQEAPDFEGENLAGK